MKAKALLLTGLLAAATFATVQDTVQFSRAYKQGEKDNYSFKIDVVLPMGAIEVTTGMTHEVVKVYENGDADVKISYSAPKAMMNGTDITAMAGQQMSTPTRTVRMNKQGVVVTKPTGGQQSMMDGLNRMMAVGSTLSEKPMKVGQTVPIALDDAQSKTKVNGTMTLESITNGVAKILSEFTVSNAQTGDKPMKVKVTSLVDTATSKPNKIEGVATDLPAQGGGMAPDSVKFVMERSK